MIKLIHVEIRMCRIARCKWHKLKQRKSHIYAAFPRCLTFVIGVLKQLRRFLEGY